MVRFGPQARARKQAAASLLNQAHYGVVLVGTELFRASFRTSFCASSFLDFRHPISKRSRPKRRFSQSFSSFFSSFKLPPFSISRYHLVGLFYRRDSSCLSLKGRGVVPSCRRRASQDISTELIAVNSAEVGSRKAHCWTLVWRLRVIK